MVINLIVSFILLFAGAFWLVWFVRRDLRDKIELPKHHFQNNVQSYDEHCRTVSIEKSEVEPEAHE